MSVKIKRIYFFIRKNKNLGTIDIVIKAAYINIIYISKKNMEEPVYSLYFLLEESVQKDTIMKISKFW